MRLVLIVAFLLLVGGAIYSATAPVWYPILVEGDEARPLVGRSPDLYGLDGSLADCVIFMEKRRPYEVGMEPTCQRKTLALYWIASFGSWQRANYPKTPPVSSASPSPPSGSSK